MKEYNLEELKSSRIQYDKNPPKLVIWVVFIVLIGLITIIVLANFTYKTEVVRATGILASDDKTYIMAVKQGKIENVYKKSGDYVEEGDILFDLDDTELNSQILSLTGKEEMLSDYCKGYKLLLDSLKNINFDEELNNPFKNGEKFYLEYQNIIKGLNDVSSLEEKKETLNSYIMQYENQCFQYDYEYSGIKSQLDAYENLKSEYIICANASGYINYNNELQSGMVISNNVIGTISNIITKENCVVELYIDSSHKAFIKENMEVEMAVSGLSQSAYGILKGKVLTVSNDSIQTEKEILYRILVKTDDVILKNKDKEFELSNGSVVEARIKYESITWMKWFLKKIGIIDR